MSMKRFFSLLAASAIALPSLHAGDIYRWVDDNGRVQLSDTVPEKFKKSATRIDSRQYELTPQQRAEANARAEREKARTAQAAAQARAAEAAAATRAASAASAAKAAAKPAPPPTDCATLHARYVASANCFGPFRNTNGSMKPGAFETCGPAVPYPANECSSTPSRVTEQERHKQ